MRVRVNREGQRLLLSTHNRPLRHIKLRVLFPETCQDSIDIRDIRNANKYPGSLTEVFGVNHIQLHTPSQSYPSPLIVRISQSLVVAFAQVIQNTPCANLEYKNCGGISSEGFTSTAVRSFV